LCHLTNDLTDLQDTLYQLDQLNLSESLSIPTIIKIGDIFYTNNNTQKAVNYYIKGIR
jgi:hypothetical protein